MAHGSARGGCCGLGKRLSNSKGTLRGPLPLGQEQALDDGNRLSDRLGLIINLNKRALGHQEKALGRYPPVGRMGGQNPSPKKPSPNTASFFFKVTTKWSHYQIHHCCSASAPSIVYIRKLGSSIVHNAVAWRVGSS